MVPPGPPTPMVGGGGGAQPSSLHSLVSPRTQFGMSNIPNVSSLLTHSFANAEPDPVSFAGPSAQNQCTVEPGNGFQQQFLVPQSQQQLQMRGGGMGNVGSIGPVKLEPQTGPSDHNGPAQQQMQALRGMGQAKLDPQQLQSLRGLGPVKLEHHYSDPSAVFLQQQQQLLQMSRHSPQAAAAQINLMQQQQQQQRMLLQQQQKQQQHRLQLQQQSLPARPTQSAKPNQYEPGMCARRLTHYMYHQQHRPEDNNIEFWRKFVAEYFSPNARKRWCVSQYGNGRQTTGVFPQDAWHCEICNRKPGRGFETTVEVLPRLCQIKYASGTLEELLYVDMPREYQNASGQIVLDYAKAIQESVFDQLRVVRDGQLRIVFNPDLKISSWEFCARRHEELIPRRLIIPQISQLGAVVHKYQAGGQNASSTLSSQDLQTSCNSFVSSARQLAKALEVPLVNDLGYTKRYVRCLQISEVVNSMKDLIDYSRETKTGPMDSLINFPRRTSSGIHPQQHEEQQSMAKNHNDQNSVCNPSGQLGSVSSGITSVNNSLNAPSSTTTSGITIAGLQQNSMNSRQENQMGTANSPYAGVNSVKIPSASSSNSIPPSQSPTPSSSNNNLATASHNTQMNSASSPADIPMMQQQATQSHEADQSYSQSSVQQILQEMIMSSQLSGVSTFRNEMKGVNGIAPTLNGVNCLTGNGIANSSAVGGMGFRGMGGISPRATASGIRAAMANNAMNMNGRVGMNHISQDPTLMSHQQQQDMGKRVLSGLNSFDNLHFDWKASP